MTLPLLITDLDGTVVNIMDEVIAHLFNITDTPLTPECCKVYSVHASFAPYLCHGDKAAFPDVEALNRFLVKTCWMNPNMLRRAKPYWKLWRTLLFYKFKGGKVVALTSRNRLGYGVEEATKAWLARWLPLTDVYFSMDYMGEGTAARKRKACADLMYILGPQRYIFIDDQPEVADYVYREAPEDCHVIMPDRPWTREAGMSIKACDAAEYVQHILADELEREG